MHSPECTHPAKYLADVTFSIDNNSFGLSPELNYRLPPMPSQVCGRDRLGSHAGRQEVSRCSTRGESQGTCNATRTPPPSANKAEPTLALKPRGDVTRSPKQGYQWPHKKDSCPPKIFKKKKKKKLSMGAEEVEVAQPGEQVTAEQGPVDPAGQPGTSTAPTPRPSDSTATAAETLNYMNKCQGFAKTWFKEIVEKKE